MKDKKVIAIIILSLLCLILAYIAFKPSNKSSSETLIKQLTEQYEAKEKVIKAINDKIVSQNVDYKNKLDSIGKIKPKIEIKYVKIYKDIDIHTSGELTNEFDSLFAEHSRN